MIDRILVDADRYFDLETITTIYVESDKCIKIRVIGSQDNLVYNLEEMSSNEFAEKCKAYKAEQQDLQLQQVKALQSIAESLQKSTPKESADKYPMSSNFKNGEM